MLENYTCHVKRFNVNNFKAKLLLQKSKLDNLFLIFSTFNIGPIVTQSDFLIRGTLINY